MFNKCKSLPLGRKGQSTVEYIVLVTAVLGVAILFLTGPNSPFQSKLGNTMNIVADQMGNMSVRMVGSQPLTNLSSPAPTFGTPVTP